MLLAWPCPAAAWPSEKLPDALQGRGDRSPGHVPRCHQGPFPAAPTHTEEGTASWACDTRADGPHHPSSLLKPLPPNTSGFPTSCHSNASPHQPAGCHGNGPGRCIRSYGTGSAKRSPQDPEGRRPGDGGGPGPSSSSVVLRGPASSGRMPPRPGPARTRLPPRWPARRPLVGPGTAPCHPGSRQGRHPAAASRGPRPTPASLPGRNAVSVPHCPQAGGRGPGPCSAVLPRAPPRTGAAGTTGWTPRCQGQETCEAESRPGPPTVGPRCPEGTAAGTAARARGQAWAHVSDDGVGSAR